MSKPLGEPIKVGNHLYQQCADCGRLIKMTGFWKGIHLCAPPEQRSR